MPTYRKRPRRKIPPPLAGRRRVAIVRQRNCRPSGAADASPLRGREHQYQIGPYFADFICLPARLIIEVDGGQHAEAEQRTHDLRRTAWLNGKNFRVLRFWNLDVLKNLEGVIDVIDGALRQPLPRNAARSAPSRKGRGE